MENIDVFYFDRFYHIMDMVYITNIWTVIRSYMFYIFAGIDIWIIILH